MRKVPTCLLIDQTGTIVWKGHPSERTFEKDIENLLAGKLIRENFIEMTQNYEEHKKELVAKG